MKTIRRKLTKDQRARRVIFTSTLSPYPDDNIEGLRTYEVIAGEDEAAEKIQRLKDVKFFEGTNFKYHIIRN